ncbi:LacI family DNA-binding transcriptional regulator [Methylopila sp. 73B]|uniref:LacI family DNA-binding transcriptional regulator n=1 Tax=Methylopila sp. 73B TaxID=1120792 RepID=UPI00036A5ED1|nr:LacI family DNA-binding transcriptional regulator [Methylopila sp. 73B]
MGLKGGSGLLGPNGKVKIADVARLAGVSPATVSRALNHPQIVRSELREKVARAISDLAYTRDSAARALKSRRTHTIGAIVPTLGISIFAEGVEALQNRLSEHGYTLLIGNSQYDTRREQQEARALIERGVDGVVLVGDAQTPELHALLRQHNVPYVTTYVPSAREGVPAIGIDNRKATYDLTSYLMGLGHREFGVVANVPASNDRSRARLDGVTQALDDAGLALPAERLVRADHSLAQGRMALRHLVTTAPEITALVCTTDTLAIGALAEARAMGLKVPLELSVTGFDDIELSSQCEPSLTTISIPAAEIGRAAADHLVNAVMGLAIPPLDPLPYRLIVRGSTASPRAARAARAGARARKAAAVD